MKKIFISIMVLILLVGCSSTDWPTPDGEPESSSTDVTNKITGIGDVVETSDYNFTVNGVRNSDGDSISTPEEGRTWIIVDVTIENKSSEPIAVSSILSFKVKDEDGRDKDFVFTIDLNGQMDGSILAGEKMSGEVAFNVMSEGELNLYYSKDLLDIKPTKVKIR